MAEGKFVSIAPLNGSKYATWEIQCTMALKKESVWEIVSGADIAPESGAAAACGQSFCS